jgi:hypothetical protein
VSAGVENDQAEDVESTSSPGAGIGTRIHDIIEANVTLTFEIERLEVRGR